MSEYAKIIKQAAESEPSFDVPNADDISNCYGRDPQGVLADIRAERRKIRGSHVMVRLPPHVKASLEKEAKKRGLGISTLLRMVVIEHFAKNPKPKKGKIK